MFDNFFIIEKPIFPAIFFENFGWNYFEKATGIKYIGKKNI